MTSGIPFGGACGSCIHHRGHTPARGTARIEVVQNAPIRVAVHVDESGSKRQPVLVPYCFPKPRLM
jgi:hypothetical protein